MKKRGRGKKGQVMGMPFVFIFSLILIAVAIFVGFWAIRYFLQRAEQANINDFVNQVGRKVDKVWTSEEASEKIELTFSKRFNYVCFRNSENCGLMSGFIPDEDYFCQDTKSWESTPDDNLFLWPFGTAEKYNTRTAWHIRCGTKECFQVERTICFPVQNGKVTFLLTKTSGEPVKISRI